MRTGSFDVLFYERWSEKGHCTYLVVLDEETRLRFADDITPLYESATAAGQQDLQR